jgi:hypothetical protein
VGVVLEELGEAVAGCVVGGDEVVLELQAANTATSNRGASGTFRLCLVDAVCKRASA